MVNFLGCFIYKPSLNVLLKSFINLFNIFPTFIIKLST
nr:MAG TPA: hypothetical protein [Caudoviricetes sp.]